MWDLGAKVWDRSPAPTTEDDEARPSTASSRDHEKNRSNESSNAAAPDDASADNDSIDKNVQRGVQEVQAVSSAWDMKSLVLVYIFIYLIFVVDALQQQMTTIFTPYVTSSFSLHSLTATTGILSNLLSGLCRLPLAKVLDVWGRSQGFAVMLFFMTIGIVMMAACNNVETYCAAQVFYWIGYTGIQYVLSVVMADTSSLRNRGLIYGLTSTPYLYTTWAGGPAAQRFLDGVGWRWGFGSFAIIVPIISAPLCFIFAYNKRKAVQQGIFKPKQSSGRSVLQSISFYIIELDIPGLILICGGLALFLLPFSLYSYQTDQWRSPMIICMLVFGIVLLVIFGLYEKFYAPKSFLPISLLLDRTVLGSCIYAGLAFVSFYIWDSYFYSFLIVNNNLSVTHASYVTNIYSIGSCFWSVLVGLAIRYTGRFKWLALYFGVPISVLGVALMIHFRAPNVNIGYIVMCQIFIAFGGGTTVICEQVAVMAATTHQNIAVALAIQYAFSSVGGAIGSSISAAVWTGVFPRRLAEYLPADAQANLTSIYGDLTVQSSYPVGSPTRLAIERAYGDSQRYMLMGGASFLAVGIFFVMMWKDIVVKHNKQVKGLVM